VEVVEKQQGFALLDVPELDAIRKTGFLVGDQALDGEALQLLVGKPVEAAERRGIETCDAEGHGDFLLSGIERPKPVCRSAIRLSVPCCSNRKWASRRLVDAAGRPPVCSRSPRSG
jgi:hypothetical protein